MASVTPPGTTSAPDRAAECGPPFGAQAYLRIAWVSLDEEDNDRARFLACFVAALQTAGRVEAVGANVKQFQPGDEVFGMTFKHGGFAEYLCAPEDKVVLEPASMSFAEAAAAPLAGITALQGLLRRLYSLGLSL
jgi:hypothetical protein